VDDDLARRYSSGPNSATLAQGALMADAATLRIHLPELPQGRQRAGAPGGKTVRCSQCA